MTLLHINDGGTGATPVVFLHSLGGHGAFWQPQLDHLRQTGRAIALDLRGHGSSPSEETYTLSEMAQDVVDTLAGIGVDRFFLVGHSMGGAVANKLVGLYPERAVGLLLADAAGDSSQIPRERAQGLIAALASPAYDSVVRGYWDEILVGGADSTKQAVIDQLMQTPKEAVVSIFRELVAYKPIPDLARFDRPKLIISTIHSEAPFSLANLRPDIPHLRVEGTSHWLQMDKPAEFNGHLEGFLGEVRR
ncbi:MAG: alpha/beta fold hydrolase [Chloroflexota bacterium]